MSLKGIDSIVSQTIAKGKKIISTDILNLVEHGENFGGELLKIDIVTEDEKTQTKEVIHAVGKMIPPSEVDQKIFDIQNIFKSEVAFYEKIFPMLQDFQRENNVLNVIDFVGSFYGARINLNGSDVVDKDAVILLENLIPLGYKNIDRYVGYNLEEAKILLKDLAALHAVPIALKLKKPEFFEQEFRPMLNKTFNPNSEVFVSAVDLIGDILWDSDKCAPFVPKVQKIWKSYIAPRTPVPREPFATLTHSDLWINNVMIKHEDGHPVGCKLVDFQLYTYKSPATDVLNFLFTSVQTEVLRQEIDNLLMFYHSQFIDNLRSLGCDLEPFSYSKFQEELSQESKTMLAWSFFFILFIVFGPKAAEGTQLFPPDAITFGDIQFRDSFRKRMPSTGIERLQFIVEFYGKQKWL